MRTAKRLLRRLARMCEVMVIGLGVVAVIDLATLHSPNPPIRVVQVDGASMEPTLVPGDRVLFARLPWERGSVVIADVDEEDLVVKRVGATVLGRAVLAGDNRAVSETYSVEPASIKGVLVCRIPLPGLGRSRASAASRPATRWEAPPLLP